MPGSPDPLPPEVEQYFQEQRIDRFTPDISIVVITIGIIAISAGVWMSRRFTKPLRELEEAAVDIGHQDLTRRVPIHGSQEFVAVATSFNEMATLLEQEETLRRSLLGDVAHELRHPVHILQGNLQAILDDVYPLTKEEISRLLDQTNQLSVLVNDLHLLTQAEAQQLPLLKQDVDIAILVKEVAGDFSSSAAVKNINLRIELLGTIPDSIYIDNARIRQAINNLLDNAIRHTPDSGSVTVTVKSAPKKLQISISDTGEGIPSDQLPYVFDRFYQIDKARNRRYVSTGLGLSIVKAIIEAHNGTIEVNSQGQGQGTTFTIILEDDTV